VHEFIDLFFSVATSSLVVVGVSLQLEAFLGRVQLEGPQEVIHLLEVRAEGGDLMDDILNRYYAMLAKLTLNDAVVSERDSLGNFADFAKTSFVQ